MTDTATTADMTATTTRLAADGAATAANHLLAANLADDADAARTVNAAFAAADAANFAAYEVERLAKPYTPPPWVVETDETRAATKYLVGLLAEKIVLAAAATSSANDAAVAAEAYAATDN